LPRRLLTNTFGFGTRCFVCDPDNKGGMRQSFYYDDDAGRVVSDFVPSADLSGAPNYVHGGASMAVLDDAMAWAIIVTKERFGLSRRVESDFIRPVIVGSEHHVEAWVESFEDRSLEARAELRNADGKLCVASKGTYMVMTLAEAEQAIGGASGTPLAYTKDVR